MRPKRKLNGTDIALIICAGIAISFTIACLWLFYKFQTEPTALIAGVFASIFGETSATAMVYKAKQLRKKGDNNNGNDELADEQLDGIDICDSDSCGTRIWPDDELD